MDKEDLKDPQIEIYAHIGRSIKMKERQYANWTFIGLLIAGIVFLVISIIWFIAGSKYGGPITFLVIGLALIVAGLIVRFTAVRKRDKEIDSIDYTVKLGKTYYKKHQDGIEERYKEVAKYPADLNKSLEQYFTTPQLLVVFNIHLTSVFNLEHSFGKYGFKYSVVLDGTNMQFVIVDPRRYDELDLGVYLDNFQAKQGQN